MYKYKRANSKYKLIKWLLILLFILIIYDVIVYKAHTKAIEDTVHKLIKAKQEQIITNNKVDKWKITAKQFTTACHKVNKLVVLEGDRSVMFTYSMTKGEINNKHRGNAMKFLVNKLNELKTKEITVSTSYHYEYSFDFNMLEPKIVGNEIIINIDENLLNLAPLAPIKDSTAIFDKTRLLSGKFSPQEVNAVIQRTNLYTFNQMSADNELHKKALDSAMEDIQSIAEKFGIGEKIKFHVYNHELVDISGIVVVK